MTPDSPAGRSAFVAALEPLSGSDADPLELTDLILSLLLIHRELSIQPAAASHWHRILELTESDTLDDLFLPAVATELQAIRAVLAWSGAGPHPAVVTIPDDVSLRHLGTLLRAFPGPGRTSHRSLADSAVGLLLGRQSAGRTVSSRSCPVAQIVSAAAAGSVHHHSVVLDPVCGAGELLFRVGLDAAEPQLIARDLNPRMLRIAQLRAALRNITVEVEQADATTERPDDPVGADVVLSDVRRHIAAGSDDEPEKIDRLRPPPPSVRLHYRECRAVLQRAVEQLTPTGRGYVMIPSAALDWAGTDAIVRQLVESGALQAIMLIRENRPSASAANDRALCLLRPPVESTALPDVLIINARHTSLTPALVSHWFDMLRDGRLPTGVPTASIPRAVAAERPHVMTGFADPAGMSGRETVHDEVAVTAVGLDIGIEQLHRSAQSVQQILAAQWTAPALESVASLIQRGWIQEIIGAVPPQDPPLEPHPTRTFTRSRRRLAFFRQPGVRADLSSRFMVGPEHPTATEGDLLFSSETPEKPEPIPAGGAEWLVRSDDRVLRANPEHLDPGYLRFCLETASDITRETASATPKPRGIPRRSTDSNMTSRKPSTDRAVRYSKQVDIDPWAGAMVPLLPLAEQREMLDAWEHLKDFATAAHNLSQEARKHQANLARLLHLGSPRSAPAH